jgi:hypothetical protein
MLALPGRGLDAEAQDEMVALVNIIVTGAENSGTGMVTALLRAAGANVTHRAVPHVGERGTTYDPLWLLVGPIDAVVFVARHHPAQESSQLQRSGRSSTALYAFMHVSEFCSEQDIPMYVWTYEAIVHEWPRAFEHGCYALGLDVAATWSTVALSEPPRDENRKHYESQEARRS